PDSGAYLVFTSGSTGRPKGVVNTHRGVVNRLSDSQRYIRLTSDDVVLQKTTAGFDVFAWEIFGTLMTGARLVVATRGGHRDPLYLGRMIVEHGVTVVDFVPSMLALVLEEGGLAGCTTLRTIACGGEEMPVPLAKRLLEELPGIEIYNQYGPSEASIDCTVHPIKDSLPKGLDRIPIGTAIQNVGLYVLDAELRPQLVGVPGELFIAGVAVARGYVRRAALTAERFLPDPYGEPGGRMYRTGDRARWLADGTLEYLGRTDDQVKIRGVRIEPGEVEAALTGLAVVRDAAVLVREDVPGDKRLVAYYVPTAEAEARSEADPATLRAELGRSLPEHMVPAAFVKLERIPVTPNGKTDRRALPAPEQDAFARGAYVAPRTPVEESVAAVWSRVLGVDQVGVEDSFFELGGDSIRAVALVGALRAAGFETSIQQVFEGRTVAALCAAFPDRRETVRGTTGIEPFALITEQDRERLADDVVDAYPLSQVQTGMVAEMLVGEEGNAYHTISTVRIRDEKPFVADALRQAWRVVAERHETLRTSVHVNEYSRPLQLVHATADVVLGVRDLGEADRQETENALREFVLAERSNHLDLGVAPLIRLFVHTTAGDGWWLSFTSPHVILDGWSHESLLMELLDCYTRLRDGLEPESYELPAVRYADFIAGELESLDSEEDRAYWREAIDGYAAFTIPVEWGDSAKTAESYGIQVEYGDLTEDLRKAAASVDVPLKSVLLAAHLKVMSMLTDEPAFHTGLVCHARPEAEGADRLIGMQVNTLPFVADRTARTWRELVRQVFTREVELWGYRRFPMPEIQREAGGGRLVDVLFNFVDFHQVDDGIVDTGMAFNDAPKEFGLSADATGSRISLSANTRTLSRKHGRRIAGMYRSVLEAMAADFDGDARAVYLPEG
ncbi:amino acid adenylation domain-containing protein, partial [Streptomyces sp. NPDC001816]|uniref:amino acid adenylation domain-containing protein n=1 Tax=Streptomyces sp. NPDC001816 TaxID=3364612 RepID=UPI0036C3CE37